MANLAISEVRICNMAVALVGASGTIESIDENSAEAQQCNLWYTYARQQCLAAYDWSFARGRLTLAAHSDDPPDGVWAYRYQYPSDCVVMRKLQNPTGVTGLSWVDDASGGADAIPFEIELGDDRETKSILSDLDDAIAVYTVDLVEVTLFSQFFVLFLATNLAARIAFTLTGKQEMEDKMWTRYNQMAQMAQSSDANEKVGKPPRDAEWIRART